ncbi:MAG: HEAT repeat domain-containing protein [Thermodesulfobacteriota bacterium]
MTDAISQAELVRVIADVLEMGHVENVVAMFKEDPALHLLVGDLIRDQRYMVRLGVAVLFEELVAARPAEAAQAVPALIPLLAEEDPFLRGEAATVLGIIGGPLALAAVARLTADPDPQVALIAQELAGEASTP